MRGTVTLDEALRTFAGLSIRDYGGLGGLKTVSIRNFGSQHTGFSYDGITITDSQNGQVDIGRFNLEDLREITVEISGSDDIFRSARLAGSVGSIILRSAIPEDTRTSVGLRAGSFATWNPYLHFRTRMCVNWSASLWADYLNSKGDYPFTLQNGGLTTSERRLGSDVSRLKGEANIYGRIPCGSIKTTGNSPSLHFKLCFDGSNRGLPGSVVYYTQNPTERLRGANVLASGTYEQGFHNIIKIKAGVNYSGDWSQYTNTDHAYPKPVNDRYIQHQSTLWAAALWQILNSDKHRLDISLAQDFVLSTLDANITHCFYPIREASYTAFSAKYSFSGFTVTGTLLGTVAAEQARHDTTAGDTTPNPDPNTVSGPSPDSPAPLRWRVCPSISASYRIPSHVTDIHLRASYKDSYRMPTFNDCYYPRVGNKTLNPEIAYQTNLGLTWQHSIKSHRLNATADAYYNLVKDKITAVPSMFIWSMRNIGRVQMGGIDLTASWTAPLASWLEASVSGTYSHQLALDTTNPAAKNYRHQIAYSPRNMGSVQLTLKTSWVYLTYTLQAAGERFSLSQNTSAYRLAPYADHGLNLGGDWTLPHRIILHAGIQALNLAGTNYELIQYYPMPGRHFRINLKIEF